MPSCILKKCFNHNRLAKKFIFFAVPKDPDRLKIWSNALKEKIIPKPNGRICSEHFHVTQVSYKRNGVPILNKNATPLFYKANIQPNIQSIPQLNDGNVTGKNDKPNEQLNLQFDDEIIFKSEVKSEPNSESDNDVPINLQFDDEIIVKSVVKSEPNSESDNDLPNEQLNHQFNDDNINVKSEPDFELDHQFKYEFIMFNDNQQNDESILP